MVGQDVLGRAADSRAQQTYLGAEAALHECLQLHHHVDFQDQVTVRAIQPTQPGPALG